MEGCKEEWRGRCYFVCTLGVYGATVEVERRAWRLGRFAAGLILVWWRDFSGPSEPNRT